MKLPRIETHRTFISNSQIFLSIAMRNYEEFLPQNKVNDLTFRYEELAISSFFYCFSAMDARINEIYISKNEAINSKEFDEWQDNKNLKGKLTDLLGNEAMSEFHQNILREVIEFHNSLAHPVPVVKLKTLKVVKEAIQKNGIISHTSNVLNNEIEIVREKFKNAKRKIPNGYELTNLPYSPFDLNKEQLQCCLLVLLEWAVFLDTKFKDSGNWPFYGSVGVGKIQSITDWFEQIRNDYFGAHRNHFDGINTDLAKHR